MGGTTLDLLMAERQFSIPQARKEAMLLEELNILTQYHRNNCDPYDRAVTAHPNPAGEGLAALPFVPVRMFKTHRLASIPDSDHFKTMTSSGTTGQQVSQIVLDRTTADLQTQALTKIMRTVLGPQRLPMIIVDTPNVVRNRKSFSARGAGVLGMMSYGRKHFYALNDNMELDREGLREFLDRHAGQNILIFGFTFMVWKYFLLEIERDDYDLSSAILIHSGGWKKLVEESVDNTEFQRRFRQGTGLARIHNYYGMVEQVGSVFMEADDGLLRPPNFSDVIVRDPVTWAPALDGQVGVIQVLSVLPRSYPGHSILTEDLGIVHGVDESDQWSGKRLEVIGRVPAAELRGCSDTHAADASMVRV